MQKEMDQPTLNLVVHPYQIPLQDKVFFIKLINI